MKNEDQDKKGERRKNSILFEIVQLADGVDSLTFHRRRALEIIVGDFILGIDPSDRIGRIRILNADRRDQKKMENNPKPRATYKA